MSRLMHQMLAALREKPSRCGYVLGALLIALLVFALADFLPAPYDLRR